MDEEVSSKRFPVGLVLAVLTGAFIGAGPATDTPLTTLLFGWGVLSVTLWCLSS